MQFLSKTVLKKFISDELKNVGFDESHIDSAFKKHIFLSIKIFDLTLPQATILKQSALSNDCDCALHRGVLNNSIDKTDCILSGTVKQLENTMKSLYNQPFSMSKLADNVLDEINRALDVKFNSKIMGILNLTPDSFSDGGEFLEIDKAMNHAIDMIEQGAKAIDIGAQSTAPSAPLVSINYEIEKIIPILISLKTAYPQIELSVDTFNLASAQAAIQAGADIINDVSNLSNPEFVNLAKKNRVKLLIMHSRGDSFTMDNLTQYDSLIDDIYKDLFNKTALALDMGLDRDLIIADVGFGFAKNIGQNFELLKRINEFKSLGFDILAGVSRKRFLQDVINTKEPKDADIQTALATSYLIEQGIEYIRVHNVELSMQAYKFQERLF